MKFTGRVVATLALGFLIVGLVGCGQDNEKAAEITGVAPTAEGGGPVTYEDYGQQQMQNQQQQYQAEGYPGAN